MTESQQEESADELEVLDAHEEEVSEELEPVSYFGTDFDVHGLVRRLNEGEILVPSFDPHEAEGVEVAGFQRKLVWKRPQMIRFVESLLLGFPVPGIFLVQQSDRKHLVLDGQQRLKTLQYFYAGEFELSDVVSRFEGRRYETLELPDRRTLDNTFIHATIVRFEEGSEESIYQLFERLNTGGTNLYPHEIRVALYGGELISLVRELNRDENWRSLFGKPNIRLKDQELILRYLALFHSRGSYERPLRSFLNGFAKRHRSLQGLDEESIRDVFRSTCSALNDSLGPTAFRRGRAINAALVDAVMVGMAERVRNKGGAPEPTKVQAAHASLLENEEFLTAISRATADEESVKARIAFGIDAFKDC